MSFLRSFRSVTAPALKRGYAAHAAAPVNPNANRSLLQQVLPPKSPAALHLKSGQTFHGQAFGHPESRFGETVFTTSITSCKSRYLTRGAEGMSTDQ
jgi:carbamoyl-phosphate synthase small subunit